MAVPLRLTASGVVLNAPCRVYYVSVKGGSDAATVALANQGTSGGTELFGWGAATTVYSSANVNGFIDFPVACYATITGTSPVINITNGPIPNG